MMSSPLYLTSHSLCLTSCPLYLYHHIHSLNDITATLCMISHTVYMWHPIHYVYDIISIMYDNTTWCVVDTTLGICMTSFALQMISLPLYHTKRVFMMSHLLKAWHHTHCIRHCTHCIFVITIFHWYHTHLFLWSEFCHTLDWNSHVFTCVPHPDPLSHLPLHLLHLGFPSAPCPSTCLMHPTWARNLFHPRYYRCFDAVLLKHSTLSFSHRV